MKGKYYSRNVKKTKDQNKKHVSQMNEQEIRYLTDKLNQVDFNETTISSHLQEKDIWFSFRDILNALRKKNIDKLILEYNESPVSKNSTDYRVLIRDDTVVHITFYDKQNKPFVAPAYMCFVFSLKKNQIVTLYWNKVHDKHNSIDWERYDPNLQIIKTK